MTPTPLPHGQASRIGEWTGRVSHHGLDWMLEIEIDIPGFAVDEPAEQLGSALKLPRFLEQHRATIAAALPDLG